MAYQSKYTGAEVDALLDKINNDDVGEIDSSLSTESENPVMNKVITEELNKKQDKEEGKGLSSNDFTDEEKEKLASLENQLTELSGELSDKQDAIPDLDDIRAGASMGATALQEVPEGYVTSEELSAAVSDKVSAAEVQAMINENNNQIYGIEWYTETVTNPSFTAGQSALIRTGNLELHKSLPVQSRMLGCLLDDDGVVTKYLNPNNWEEDELTGERGQVMVEVPDFFIRYTDEEVATGINRRKVDISLQPFDGAIPVKRFYVGAYEAYRDGNGKLCSIAGVLPTTAISMTTFRTAARNRNTANNKWNILPYEQYKVIFWLYMVEYANRNSQAAVNTSRDANGFRQGGLGIGVTNLSNWSEYNGSYSFVITGTSNALGDDSGEVNISASEYVNNGVTLVTIDSLVHVNRYRGIELPFGHLYKFIDGIRVDAASETDRTVYTTDDTAKFASGDTSISGWANIGKEAGAEGYVKKLIFGSKGEIMASEVGASSTSYWSDYRSGFLTGLRAVLFGATAGSGALSGLAFSHSTYAPSNALAYFGSRLCFIP